MEYVYLLTYVQNFVLKLYLVTPKGPKIKTDKGGELPKVANLTSLADGSPSVSAFGPLVILGGTPVQPFFFPIFATLGQELHFLFRWKYICAQHLVQAPK